MYTNVNKALQRERRRAKIRAKIRGTSEVPRLAVFRSNRYIYAQLLDDTNNQTLVSICDKVVEADIQALILGAEELQGELQTPKVTSAYKLGKLLAAKAKASKISKVVFDRAGYKYHGRVKALADGARAGGLIF